jgi:hypothetical protein
LSPSIPTAFFKSFAIFFAREASADFPGTLLSEPIFNLPLELSSLLSDYDGADS